MFDLSPVRRRGSRFLRQAMCAAAVVFATGTASYAQMCNNGPTMPVLSPGFGGGVGVGSTFGAGGFGLGSIGDPRLAALQQMQSLGGLMQMQQMNQQMQAQQQMQRIYAAQQQAAMMQQMAAQRSASEKSTRSRRRPPISDSVQSSTRRQPLTAERRRELLAKINRNETAVNSEESVEVAAGDQTKAD